MANYCWVYGVIHFVTCGLTACTPGSAPGPTLGNEYGKTLPLPLLITSQCMYTSSSFMTSQWVLLSSLTQHTVQYVDEFFQFTKCNAVCPAWSSVLSCDILRCTAVAFSLCRICGCTCCRLFSFSLTKIAPHPTMPPLTPSASPFSRRPIVSERLSSNSQLLCPAAEHFVIMKGRKTNELWRHCRPRAMDRWREHGLPYTFRRLRRRSRRS